ncbi:hypothetical protein, partial [Escherichia coli]|uniref:hypothetical protein n=1 Tax=Escherichia coli TaxID=562 RepID=UPI00203AE130
ARTGDAIPGGAAGLPPKVGHPTEFVARVRLNQSIPLKQNWLWLIIICPVKTENRVQPTFLVLKEHLSVAGSGHGSSTVQKA